MDERDTEWECVCRAEMFPPLSLMRFETELLADLS